MDCLVRREYSCNTHGQMPRSAAMHCRAVESSAFDAFDALQPDIGDNLHELLCYRTNKAMNTLRVRTPRSTP